MIIDTETIIRDVSQLLKWLLFANLILNQFLITSYPQQFDFCSSVLPNARNMSIVKYVKICMHTELF